MLSSGRLVSNVAEMPAQDSGAMKFSGSLVARFEKSTTAKLCCRSSIRSNVAEMPVQDSGAIKFDGSLVARLEKSTTAKLCWRSSIRFNGLAPHCCLVLAAVRVAGSSSSKSFAGCSVDAVRCTVAS